MFLLKNIYISFLKLIKIGCLLASSILFFNAVMAQKISKKPLYKGYYHLILNTQKLKNKVGKFEIGDSVIFNKENSKEPIIINGTLKNNPRIFVITFSPDTLHLPKRELLNKSKIKQFVFLLTAGRTKIMADDRPGEKWKIEAPNSLQAAFQNYFDTISRLESYHPRKIVDYERYRDSIAKNFLIPQFDKNKSNFVGAIIINVLIGYLHKQEDCHFLDSIYNCLGQNIQSLPIIKRRMDNIKHGCSYVGRKAQGFVLKNIKGKDISLTDFKGQYLLIDIWASWCLPCREENQVLKKIYQKYVKSGFNILSVSTDSNKNNWVKAVEKDKLSWPQASLLDESKTSTDKFNSDYFANVLPSNFLINPEGIIIAKDITSENLEKKLASIFKKLQ